VWGVIGLGVDVVDLERFAEVLERRPSITRRIFTDEERAYCERARINSKRVERYAGRFAVKEAVHKALGVGLGAFKLHDVQVTRVESGAPSIEMRGRAAELAGALGIGSWHVSITHDRVTVAVVVAE
jgi:holo-[acyl-carrier protein] synthase